MLQDVARWRVRIGEDTAQGEKNVDEVNEQLRRCEDCLNTLDLFGFADDSKTGRYGSTGMRRKLGVSGMERALII